MAKALEIVFSEMENKAKLLSADGCMSSKDKREPGTFLPQIIS
jgi:hypothetical protein